MLKILLVYDDFQELTSVELMLRKIGFDVVGITSEFSLAEQLLSFNPQIVVAQGRTAKVSTSNVGRRLREAARWDGHSVLVFYSNAKPQPTELLKIRMDVGLEYPVEPTKLVQVLAQLGNLDVHQLLDKLIKSMAQEPTAAANKENSSFSNRTSNNEAVFVSGGAQAPKDGQKFVSGHASEEKRKALSESTSFENLDKAHLTNSGNPLDIPIENVTGMSETDSQNPLFPLPQSGAEEDSDGSTRGQFENLNNDSNTAENLDKNPFELTKLDSDNPVSEELEDLLDRKKPDLSLTPPLQDSVRHKKYEEYMKSIPVQQLSSIRRKDAKLRLKDLIKDLPKSELEDQDVLRREYVKALFKKGG
jgi:hypothetical protein